MQNNDSFHGLTNGEWCVHASLRRPVNVYAYGGIVRATLIAWRPTRRNRRTRTARVEYATGKRATVKIEHITPVLEVSAD